MGWCTLRFRSVDQISTACTIAGVMMYSLKKTKSEFDNAQDYFWRCGRWRSENYFAIRGEETTCNPKESGGCLSG